MKSYPIKATENEMKIDSGHIRKLRGLKNR